MVKQEVCVEGYLTFSGRQRSPLGRSGSDDLSIGAELLVSRLVSVQLGPAPVHHSEEKPVKRKVENLHTAPLLEPAMMDLFRETFGLALRFQQ